MQDAYSYVTSNWPDVSMEVKNAVNTQRVIWIMQDIYYEWLVL